jgi:hypothetical protein
VVLVPPVSLDADVLLCAYTSSVVQSEVEATLERIKSHPGVEGVIIGQSTALHTRRWGRWEDTTQGRKVTSQDDTSTR